VWPLPENVGLVLDRDDGLRVVEVLPKSAADRAGLKAGDRLAAAGERKLFGQADLRGVLHRGPRGAGSIEVRWWREGELMNAALELRDGWRKTVLGWRMSVSQGNVGAVPGFAWPHACTPELRRKLAIPAGSMAIKPWFGDRDDWPAQRAGLTADDVIVAVAGKSPDVSQRDFLTWFRMQYDPGDTAVLTVRDARGRDREIRYAAPGSD
jgi:S1-C subfamily serine protease